MIPGVPGAVVQASGEADASLLHAGLEALLRGALDGAAGGAAWHVHRGRDWISVRRPAGDLPDQGWKIHVSAGVLTAADVLRRAVPVLVRESVDFKVAASIEHLARLNEGRGGLGQVGKFVTAYPADDAAAVRVAVRLDKATGGLRGPRIPSDRRLRPLSLVHYRYGGFGSGHVRTPIGENLPAITAPDGTVLPDRREPWDTTPAWAVDPFAAAGVAEQHPEEARTLGRRFAVLAPLYDSPRARVDLCLDLTSAGSCVVKRAYDDGSGSWTRLRHEHDVLRRLAGAGAPRPLALFTHGHELCLAMTDVPGTTLGQVLSELRQANRSLPAADLTSWATRLAALLAGLHDEGLVHGDVKPSNIIVTAEGDLRLVDFELASAPGALPAGDAQGTHGYRSPQRVRGAPASFADDDYAFGAVLYACATGAEPSQAPLPDELLRRPVRLLDPRVAPGVAGVVEACLVADPRRRPTASAAADRLAAATDAGSGPAPPRLPAPEAAALAVRIGDLLATAFAGDFPEVSLDLNTGAAGALLVLAELARQPDTAELRVSTASGARRLYRAWSRTNSRLPGLYVGDAGIGAALLRAGQVLDDDELTGAALDVVRNGRSTPAASPDLFNGTAGRVRSLLWSWAASGDEDLLDEAVERATSLAARRGGAGWPIPDGYGTLSGRRQLGYAHGAAGIGDVLLDVFEVTGHDALLESATAVGTWLERTAMPTGDHPSGLNWPAEEGGRATMAFWCHGAAGIVRFLLHLHAHTRRPLHLALAERAGLVVASGTRWAGPTQCHGLAGNLEGLLDLHRATAQPRHLEQAGEFGQLLSAFVVERSGHVEVVTDRDAPNLGFSTGAAGVAAALLRLAHPDRPHLLSLHGLGRADGRSGGSTVTA